MHYHLRKIFETGQVPDKVGQIHKLSSGISLEEGLYIQEILKETKPNISLEVGLAQGISTMFICEALKEINSKKHIVIDPFQIESGDSGFNWSGLGLYNLEQCNYQDIVDFRNEKSEIILPKLLVEGLRIDFALIDGNHTFDHVLLDFFYINRMLNIGGVVVFDDASMKSINKVINYILNYPSYVPYNIKTSFSRIKKNKIYTWPSIHEKLIKNPKILSNLMKRYSNQIISPIINFYTKNFLGMKKNVRILKNYYALQKIADDNRSWLWYEKF